MTGSFEDPIVEDAYQKAIDELMLSVPEESGISENNEIIDELKQELEAAGVGLENLDAALNGDLGENLKEKVLAFRGHLLIHKMQIEDKLDEKDRREVLGLIFKGLRRNEAGTLTYPEVVKGNDGSPFTNHESIPEKIAHNKKALDRGIEFVAETAFIAARMLTDEVVEAIVRDGEGTPDSDLR
jgi:hypothetical protein